MPTPSPAPTANQYLSNIVGSNSNLTQDQLSGLLNNFQSNPGWSNNIDYENGGGTLDYTDPNTGTMYHYDQSGNLVGSNSASQIASWQDNSGWLSGPLGLGLGLAAAAVLAPELLPEMVGGETAAGVALDSAGNLIPGSILANGATVAADGSIIGADGSLLAPAGSASVSGAAAAVAPAAATTPSLTSLSDLSQTAPVADQGSSLYGLANTSSDATNAAQGITAPASTGTTSLVNPSTANLADTGGAQGISSAAQNTSLASMGGAQGITTPSTAALGDASSFINSADATAAANAANVGATSVVSPTSTANLGSDTSLVNSGTSGTVGAASSPVTSAISPSVTDGTAAAGGGLLSNLSPLQMASLGGAAAQGIGGLLTGNAISSAQAQQQTAANQAQSTLSGIYSGLNQQLAPYQQAGQQGTSALTNNLGYFQNQFNNQDLNAQLAPNYAFSLQQGQMANQRAANVGGGALSGNTLQGLDQYTQNYAQNAYQNAFNNYQTQRTGIYNTLAGIAGLGTSANQQAVAAGSQYGNQATNLATGIAAANAGATVGQAQNTSNTLSNLTNNLTLASLLGQKAG